MCEEWWEEQDVVCRANDSDHKLLKIYLKDCSGERERRACSLWFGVLGICVSAPSVMAGLA